MSAFTKISLNNFIFIKLKVIMSVWNLKIAERLLKNVLSFCDFTDWFEFFHRLIWIFLRLISISKFADYCIEDNLFFRLSLYYVSNACRNVKSKAFVRNQTFVRRLYWSKTRSISIRISSWQMLFAVFYVLLL